MQIDMKPAPPMPAAVNYAKGFGGKVSPRDPAAMKAFLKNQKAARDFESMLLAPVLDSLQKTFGGTAGGSMVGAGDYRQMATQALAQAIAARGGIGIAPLILRHLQSEKVHGGK